jgi:hypothetical protein
MNRLRHRIVTIDNSNVNGTGPKNRLIDLPISVVTAPKKTQLDDTIYALLCLKLESTLYISTLFPKSFLISGTAGDHTSCSRFELKSPEPDPAHLQNSTSNKSYSEKLHRLKKDCSSNKHCHCPCQRLL